MKRTTIKNKKAQNLFNDDLREEEKGVDVLTLESEEELPVVTEEEALGYLADEFGEEKTFEEPEVPEVPIEISTEEIPEFASASDALSWAIQNNKVLRINYVTKKGIDLTRIIEPHALFAAGTGNLIVISFDRSIRNIRAFIVDSILNYIFTGKEFKERIRILPTTRKRKIAMKNDIFKNLKNIGDDLEKEGLYKSAEIVTGSMENLFKIKKAQYVGVQGYWLRNRRCWDNCYRHKRATQPGTPAQEVWMSCWEEYLGSINNDKSGWEKYANKEEKEYKVASNELLAEQRRFITQVKNNLIKKISIGEAVYNVFNKEAQRQMNILIDNSDNLVKLAEILNKNGYKEISEKLAKISLSMVKESDFGGNWWQKAVNFFRSNEGKIAKRLKYLIQRINYIIRQVEGGSARWASLKQKNIKAQVTPQQTRLLKTVTDEYHQFLSDLREEMAFLKEMSIKNPRLTPLVTNILQAMNSFDKTSTTAFKEYGGFPGRVILDGLRKLLNDITTMETGIEISSGVAPEQISQMSEIETTAPGATIPIRENLPMAAYPTETTIPQQNVLNLNNLKQYKAPYLQTIRGLIQQELNNRPLARDERGRILPRK